MLTDVDRKQIVEAIRLAETRTSGEIYCVVAKASSTYRVFPIAYASTAALIVPLPLIQLTSWPAGLIYLLQLLTFLVILYAGTRDAVRYRLVPRQTRRARCHQEALKQFAAHGLQHTELRTGVLIFVSLAERYAEVIADAGIDQNVAPDVWDGCVKPLIAEASSGQMAQGLTMSISRCADVLAEHFPPGRINRDELPNAVVELD
jgi:putative membrane protein